MKHFDPVPEPAYFDRQVRQKGLRFIARYANPKKYPSHWSKCKECADDIRKAFSSLCAYSVIFCDDGHVDHFISQSESCESNMKHLIYEWTNYRYVNPIVNQSKSAVKSSEILDPFEVKDVWFRVILPTGKLEMTDQLPKELKCRASKTIERLHLNEGKVLERRKSLIGGFIKGKFTLQHVIDTSPIIARELLERIASANVTLENSTIELVMQGQATMGELKRTEPEAHNAVLTAIYA